MRCINCGIAMQRLQRHLISSLSAHHQTRLSRWTRNSQSQFPLDSSICHQCYLLLNTEAGEHERQLGHVMVCFGCGKSVKKIRYHTVNMQSPLLAVLMSQKTNYVLSSSNYVCHVCWMRGNRHVVHDISSDMLEIASDSKTAVMQEVNQMQPPPIPLLHKVLQRRSNAANKMISLPRFKRVSISSTRCIFLKCRNRLLHKIPQLLKRILLQEYSFYVPRSCRVCESHLNSDQWHSLPQMNETCSTFSCIQIEDIFDIMKSKSNILNFERMCQKCQTIFSFFFSHTCHK